MEGHEGYCAGGAGVLTASGYVIALAEGEGGEHVLHGFVEIGHAQEGIHGFVACQVQGFHPVFQHLPRFIAFQPFGELVFQGLKVMAGTKQPAAEAGGEGPAVFFVRQGGRDCVEEADGSLHGCFLQVVLASGYHVRDSFFP